ncbi:MAG: glycosyl transferase [Gallionellales bacterium GWA2_55_18]|nr:MAG: glycosyl transferase [Gallionellales bacterium GWA2_55_18]
MEKITAECATEISISVVSHAQIHLIENLLHDIDEHCRTTSIEFILTLNTGETLPFAADDFSFPLKIIRNLMPRGFAANHNQAFAHATGRYFCVMNPDIRFGDNPFPALLACLQNPSIGVAAPIVVGESGEMEDSARRFPTPFRIFCKAFGGCRGSDYAVKDAPIHPDWVGGMFMLFPRSIFERLGGFDQRYFLYYEDVDLCARLRLMGYEAAVCPQARVTHHAQRSSHRNFRYLRWHLRSMTRFFLSPVYWRLKCCKLGKH